MADKSALDTMETMAKSIEPIAESTANKSGAKPEDPFVKSIKPVVKSLDVTVKSFNEWLVEHGHPPIPSNESTPTPTPNPVDDGSWSVPIIFYGNDKFGWHQRDDGTHLFLDFDGKKGTFRVTRGQDHKGASLFGAEDNQIGKLTAALSSTGPFGRPIVRMVFAAETGENVKTEFRNVKFRSNEHAQELFKHLQQMPSVTVVQRAEG
ncbi:MAG: hypothetical protein Q9183_005075 [Haloplaca sp. 2 TL-2023]